MFVCLSSVPLLPYVSYLFTFVFHHRSSPSLYVIFSLCFLSLSTFTYFLLFSYFFAAYFASFVSIIFSSSGCFSFYLSLLAFFLACFLNCPPSRTGKQTPWARTGERSNWINTLKHFDSVFESQSRITWPVTTSFFFLSLYFIYLLPVSLFLSSFFMFCEMVRFSVGSWSNWVALKPRSEASFESLSPNCLFFRFVSHFSPPHESRCFSSRLGQFYKLSPSRFSGLGKDSRFWREK